MSAGGRMRVGDVMTSPAVTVAADAPLKEVITTLLQHAIAGAPVVNAGGRLVGIVTEADLLSRPAYGPGRTRPLRLVAEYFTGTDPQWLRKADGLTARDVMTHVVETIRPSADIHTAARRLLDRRIKSLVVTDDAGGIVGIVARRDVLGSYAPADDEVVTSVQRVLHDFRSVPETMEATARVESGIVTLEGSVLHPSDRRVVDAAVRALPGVIDVVDHLAAREPEPSAHW